MITGLVAITPAAGFVNSFGAMIIGVVASSLVWMSWNWLGTHAAVQEGRRHPGCIPHPRRGGPGGRAARRRAGRPAHR